MNLHETSPCEWGWTAWEARLCGVDCQVPRGFERTIRGPCHHPLVPWPRTQICLHQQDTEEVNLGSSKKETFWYILPFWHILHQICPHCFFKKHPSKSGPNCWGVFEIDGERSSVGAKLQRPLMFRYDDTSSVASDETSIQVIDSSFVFFTSIWGIALPGLRVGSTPTPNPEAAKCASDNPSLAKIHFSSCNPAGQWGNNASEK